MLPDTLAPATPSAAPASAPSLQVDAPPVRPALLDRRIWRDAGLAWLARPLIFRIPIAITIALASLTRPVGILLLVPLAAAIALPHLRLTTGAPQWLPVWLRAFLLRGDVAPQGHFPQERNGSKGLALLLQVLLTVTFLQWGWVA